MKFRFKTNKPVGKYRWLDQPSHYIYVKKYMVGSIDHVEPYKIRLKVVKNDMTEDKNPNCPWKWIALKYNPKSVDDAKWFLNANFDRITTKYKLYLDDES